MTPAQAAGHPGSFVVDVPVQGPTDEGIRAADCWHAQNRLPAQPACVDCGGPIPMWAQHSLCPGNRLTNSGIGALGESVSFGGRYVAGFALEDPGDPSIWSSLSADQQQWVQNALISLNDHIVKATGTSCPTWAPSIDKATGCFQLYYNANYAAPKAPGRSMRTDGVLDEDTLCALVMVTGLHAADFPTPFPDPQKKHCQVAPPPPPPPTPGEKKGLSTGAIIGIGAAGVAVVGGVIYAATRKGGGRRRSRRR